MREKQFHKLSTTKPIKTLIFAATNQPHPLMSEQPTPTNNFPTYKPSDLIAIFSAALGRQNEFAKLVSLRGIGCLSYCKIDF